MLYYEHKYRSQGYNIIIGVDEVGRGPLAGPVVAGAVLLNTYRFKSRIDDSKKLSPELRETAFLEIIKKSVFGIGIVGEKVIDQVNIFQATRLAMEQAVNSVVERISAVPGAFKDQKIQVLVDGNIHLNIGVPHIPIIKGDAKSKSIASASILAKVVRDRIMQLYDRLYPQYGFCHHKGYSTKEHRNFIRQFGPCFIHRKSFSYV